MKEMAYYPELTRMKLEPAQMKEEFLTPPGMRQGRIRADDFQTRIIEAVQITMPKEDFERMLSIYTAHYSAVSQHPTVLDAWMQYRVCCALTQ